MEHGLWIEADEDLESEVEMNLVTIRREHEVEMSWQMDGDGHVLAMMKEILQ